LPKKKPVDTKRFTELWDSGALIRVISEELQITTDHCDSLRKQLGLKKRSSWHGSKTGKRSAYIPTPEEIAGKCLEFQSRWTDEERARRRVGGSYTPADTPVVPDDLFGGLTSGGFHFLDSLDSDFNWHT
jgi:hypothetical protein